MASQDHVKIVQFFKKDNTVKLVVLKTKARGENDGQVINGSRHQFVLELI